MFPVDGRRSFATSTAHFHRFATMSIRPAILSVCLACLTGCITATDPEVRKSTLGFLQSGRTRQAEVIDRLGPPAGRFEQGRMLTYHLSKPDKSLAYTVVPRTSDPSGWPVWSNTRFSLVLEFDASGRLARHTLVEVK